MILQLHDNPFDELARVRAAVSGDASARQWVVERYTPMVFRYARRMLGDEQDANDAAQDSLVKVLRNLERYDERWRFTTWVLGITRNTCIDELRRRRFRSSEEAPETADPGPGPLELTARQRSAAVLQAALARLPDLYREVLLLYHFEHLKYQEIADILDIPIGTIMNRIFRARAKLREAYEAIEAGTDAEAPRGRTGATA